MRRDLRCRFGLHDGVRRVLLVDGTVYGVAVIVAFPRVVRIRCRRCWKLLSVEVDR
jgi:hypothetical protein